MVKSKRGPLANLDISLYGNLEAIKYCICLSDMLCTLLCATLKKNTGLTPYYHISSENCGFLLMSVVPLVTIAEEGGTYIYRGGQKAGSRLA